MAYETDVVAWSVQAAALLRAGDFSRFTADDIEHLADEIEDVGKSEARELKNRVAVLICHLLKWQYQPARRGRGWLTTINLQRNESLEKLAEVPSLKPSLRNEKWLCSVWENGLAQAYSETGDAVELPESCPWPIEKILEKDWLPD